MGLPIVFMGQRKLDKGSWGLGEVIEVCGSHLSGVGKHGLPNRPIRPCRVINNVMIEYLAEHRYQELLGFIRQAEDGDGLLFFSGVLRNRPDGLNVHVQRRNGQVVGAIALLPALPPFAVPVILPAGEVSSELLDTVSILAQSPHMAVGPKSATTALTKVWPETWKPFLCQHNEVLLKQLQPYRVEQRASLHTRLARSGDIEKLIDYQVQMERDAQLAQVCSRQQARHSVTRLLAADSLFVIEVEGNVSGCAALITRDECYEQLGFIFFDVRHRGREVSDRLLGDLCAAVHARGKIPLSFTSSKAPLYKQLCAIGFNGVGEQVKLYFGH